MASRLGLVNQPRKSHGLTGSLEIGRFRDMVGEDAPRKVLALVRILAHLCYHRTSVISHGHVLLGGQFSHHRAGTSAIIASEGFQLLLERAADNDIEDGLHSRGIQEFQWNDEIIAFFLHGEKIES